MLVSDNYAAHSLGDVHDTPLTAERSRAS